MNPAQTKRAETCALRVNPQLTDHDHYLDWKDHTREEVLRVLEVTRLLKEAHRQGVRPQILSGKVLGMMFFESSLRTRVSFEAAMAQLGGHAEFLTPKTMHVGDGNESMRDTAEVLSRMCDAILIRAEDDAVTREFAKFSYCPVIDGGGMSYHPSQVIADVFTMQEHLPGVPFEDMTVMFMGDNNNDSQFACVPVQRSLMNICAILGMRYIACSPESLQPTAEDVATFERLAELNGSGAQLVVTDDPDEHIAEADFLVGEVFTFKGMAEHTGLSDEELRAVRWDVLYPKYQINAELVAKAKPTVGVMHCMPGNRDEEITTEVWDGPHSLLFEEAENRLHAQKGICACVMYDGEPPAPLVAYHTGRVEAALAETLAY
ncbi:ornithine carbamoyltransferase [Olsenella sp. YH-ols2217]|uniref:Ornithine carbamoyltransferase n=1 Tax=Kribbibacterium absianum TaxID=3044210 RepID=A0ABT6ZJX4_9ACTN|nr:MULTISPECIES: ornithine carbamoyltransferase [unclassified Olsenella]MDJ1122393.1 ornithine carbamoyltransferase [Olsenella sp. YH-ols2216]MDJ1129353.1 ornithine carbamoyltransferase [Olsenella sp. YH-ols2217]